MQIEIRRQCSPETTGHYVAVSQGSIMEAQLKQDGREAGDVLESAEGGGERLCFGRGSECSVTRERPGVMWRCHQAASRRSICGALTGTEEGKGLIR